MPNHEEETQLHALRREQSRHGADIEKLSMRITNLISVCGMLNEQIRDMAKLIRQLKEAS